MLLAASRCSSPSAGCRRPRAGGGLLALSLALALAGFAAAPARAARQHEWTWLGGPEITNATAIAVDPTDPRVVYAGTEASGIYKTSSGGQGWAPVNRGLPDVSVFGMVINPHDPRQIFLQSSTNAGSIFLSSDGGANWVAQPQGHLPALFDARDGTMFALNGAALFWSLDGYTWMFLGGVPDGSGTFSLARDTADPDVFYAANYRAFFRSADGGVTFKAQATPIAFNPLGGRTTVWADPAAPGTVYVATLVGIWKSTDSGATWSLATRGLRGLRNHNRHVQTFLAVPTSPATLYAVMSDSSGTAELYRSADGAATWIDQGFFGTGGQSFFSLAAAASDPDVLYASHLFDTPGVFRSTDGGRSWSAAGSGMTAPFHGVTFQPGALGGLYALGGSSTWKSTDGGATWRDLKRRLDSLQVDPVHPDTLDGIQFGGLTTSADGGRSWSPIQYPPSCLALVEIVVAPAPRPTLYALTTPTENDCVSSPGLRSTDGGRTWQEILELDGAAGLVLDPADRTTLYAARYGQADVVKSSDRGRTWTVVGPTPATPTGGSPFRLAISPFSGELYLTQSDGTVFTSGDRARSWQPAGPPPLPQFSLVTVVPDPFVPDRVYALGPQALLRSDDGGKGWVSPARGLTRTVLLEDLAIASDGTLFAATFNGLFSLAPGPAR